MSLESRVGRIQGVASINGRPLPYCTVRAYSQTTGELETSSTTNYNGVYSLRGLDTNKQYFVAASDPGTAEVNGVLSADSNEPALVGGVPAVPRSCGYVLVLPATAAYPPTAEDIRNRSTGDYIAVGHTGRTPPPLEADTDAADIGYRYYDSGTTSWIYVPGLAKDAVTKTDVAIVYADTTGAAPLPVGFVKNVAFAPVINSIVGARMWPRDLVRPNALRLRFNGYQTYNMYGVPGGSQATKAGLAALGDANWTRYTRADASVGTLTAMGLVANAASRDAFVTNNVFLYHNGTQWTQVSGSKALTDASKGTAIVYVWDSAAPGYNSAEAALAPSSTGMVDMLAEKGSWASIAFMPQPLFLPVGATYPPTASSLSGATLTITYLDVNDFTTNTGVYPTPAALNPAEDTVQFLNPYGVWQDVPGFVPLPNAPNVGDETRRWFRVVVPEAANAYDITSVLPSQQGIVHRSVFTETLRDINAVPLRAPYAGVLRDYITPYNGAFVEDYQANDAAYQQAIVMGGHLMAPWVGGICRGQYIPYGTPSPVAPPAAALFDYFQTVPHGCVVTAHRTIPMNPRGNDYVPKSGLTSSTALVVSFATSFQLMVEISPQNRSANFPITAVYKASNRSLTFYRPSISSPTSTSSAFTYYGVEIGSVTIPALVASSNVGMLTIVWRSGVSIVVYLNTTELGTLSLAAISPSTLRITTAATSNYSTAKLDYTSTTAAASSCAGSMVFLGGLVPAVDETSAAVGSLTGESNFSPTSSPRYARNHLSSDNSIMMPFPDLSGLPTLTSVTHGPIVNADRAWSSAEIADLYNRLFAGVALPPPSMTADDARWYQDTRVFGEWRPTTSEVTTVDLRGSGIAMSTTSSNTGDRRTLLQTENVIVSPQLFREVEGSHCYFVEFDARTTVAATNRINSLVTLATNYSPSTSASGQVFAVESVAAGANPAKWVITAASFLSSTLEWSFNDVPMSWDPAVEFNAYGTKGLLLGFLCEFVDADMYPSRTKTHKLRTGFVYAYDTDANRPGGSGGAAVYPPPGCCPLPDAHPLYAYFKKYPSADLTSLLSRPSNSGGVRLVLVPPTLPGGSQATILPVASNTYGWIARNAESMLFVTHKSAGNAGTNLPVSYKARYKLGALYLDTDNSAYVLPNTTQNQFVGNGTANTVIASRFAPVLMVNRAAVPSGTTNQGLTTLALRGILTWSYNGTQPSDWDE